MQNTVTARVAHEVRTYLVLSAYLYVCFGAIILYKSAVLRGINVQYAPYGLAVVKALILAKFIMLGHATGVGDRHGERRAIYNIAWKAGQFLVLLLVLAFLEEVVSGMLHGQNLAEVTSRFLGGSLLQVLASCLLMLLILIPYLAFRELEAVLGEGRVMQIMMKRRAGHRRRDAVPH